MTPRYTRSDEFYRHWCTHTGEKNFVGKECSRGFSRRDNLSKHIKTHFKKANKNIEKTSSRVVDEILLPG